MIRYFCDFCGEEIDERNKAVGGAMNCPESRLGTTMTKRNPGLVAEIELKVEIITSMNGTANAGIVCRHCIIDALNKLDTRPQPARSRR